MGVPVVSYEDRQACEACLFEWADSYDSKDWARLARCIATTLRVDYRSFLDKEWDAMPAEEFVEMCGHEHTTIIATPVTHYGKLTREQKASSPAVLGNPLLKTQHFVGSSHYVYAPLPAAHRAHGSAAEGYISHNPDEIIGYHQLHVPHQLYTDASMTEVKVNGHAHSTNTHWYRRGEDGKWRFAGLAPDIRWHEGEFDRVFEEGRAQLGESEGKQISKETSEEVQVDDHPKGTAVSLKEVEVHA